LVSTIQIALYIWMKLALIIDGSGSFHSCIRLSFGLMICILDFPNHILHDIHHHSDIIIWIQDLIATVPVFFLNYGDLNLSGDASKTK